MIKFYLIEKITKIYNFYLMQKKTKKNCAPKTNPMNIFYFSGFQKQVDNKLMSA